MFTRLILVTAVAFFLTPTLLLMAQEHPEHPKKEGPAELPKGQPKKEAAATKAVAMADISAGIKKHIDSESKKASDKKLHVKYQDKDLALDLIKVHDDRLSDLGGGKYFACVDMKATDGKTYDLDFFLTGPPGKMNVTETTVHKVNGKPLYNWKEENGKWKKVTAK
jgi:hypothetical protein